MLLLDPVTGLQFGAALLSAIAAALAIVQRARALSRKDEDPEDKDRPQ